MAENRGTPSPDEVEPLRLGSLVGGILVVVAGVAGGLWFLAREPHRAAAPVAPAARLAPSAPVASAAPPEPPKEDVKLELPGPVEPLKPLHDGPVVLQPDPHLTPTPLSESPETLQTRLVSRGVLTRDESFNGTLVRIPGRPLLACGRRGGSVRLIDSIQGTVTADIKTGSDVRCLAASFDGSLVAAGTDAGEVVLIDVVNKTLSHTLTAGDEGVNCLAFSPTSGDLLSAGPGRAVRLWNTEDGSLKRTLWLLDDPATYVGYLPDGQTALCGAARGTVVHFRPDEGTEIRFVSVDFRGTVSSVVLAGEGPAILAGTRPLFYSTTARRLDNGLRDKVHSGIGVEFEIACVLDGGGHFVCAGPRSRLQVSPVAKHGERIYGNVPETADLEGVAALSTESFALLDADGTLERWAIEDPSATLVKRWKQPAAKTHRVVASADGRRILTKNYEGIDVWDRVERRHLGTLKGERTSGRLILTPDGSTAVTASPGVFKVWDVESRELRLELKVPRNPNLDSIAMVSSMDGKRLYTAGSDGIIVEWELENGKIVRAFRGHSQSLYRLQILDTGELASIGQDRSVRFWDLESGRESKRFNVNLKLPRPGIVSPDGRRAWLLDSPGDGTQILRVWDLDAAREIKNFSMKHIFLTSFDYSPDHRRLVTAGQGGVRFWDAETMEPVWEVSPGAGTVYSAIFLFDGTALSVDDKGIVAWNSTGPRDEPAEAEIPAERAE